ncbi:MAG: pyruvate kinase [Nitrospinota bacterium]|nr:pyruvate kinase [Nitrospinota bacterium]
MKKTKVIATLGPASNDSSTIKKMILSGADIFRINGSHTPREKIGGITSLIHSIGKELQRPVAVMLDLQGPKIRVGEFPGGSMTLKKGDKVILQTTLKKGDGTFIPVQYPEFHNDVEAGCRILLDDGNLALKVISKKGKRVAAKVLFGGVLKDKKGINLPEVSISAEPITKKDYGDLQAGLEAGVDFVALSFVRSGGDIAKLRKRINRTSPSVEIIAKIERHEAVANIAEIISEADGVMIARGDLGVELPASRVPVIQLDILQRCFYLSKPVIVATQMMESMITNRRPTRAEVSDVANSVRAYADAVMLSAETATGKYPVEAVSQMTAAALEMERYQHSKHRIPPWEWRREMLPPTDRAIAYSACRLAELLSANAIIAITESGHSVKRVASPHPNVPIFAFTRHEATMRKLSLVRAVTAFHLEFQNGFYKTVSEIFKILKKKRFLKNGDRVVITSGIRMGVKGSTNLLVVEEVK